MLTATIQYLQLVRHDYELADHITIHQLVLCLSQTLMQAVLLIIMWHTREKFSKPIFMLNLGTGLMLERADFWACEIFMLVVSLATICFTLN